VLTGCDPVDGNVKTLKALWLNSRAVMALKSG